MVNQGIATRRRILHFKYPSCSKYIKMETSSKFIAIYSANSGWPI